MRIIFFIFGLIFSLAANAENNVINVYAWAGEIPSYAVRLFEKETGIKVNISTYENNEVMYAKLRTMKNAGYDIVMPSGYFIERMAKQNLLETLDSKKLTNLVNINPEFLHPSYDPHTQYSVPFIWGVAGIFYNAKYFSGEGLKKWSDLWDNRFENKLLLLDDTRENFSMALLSLGYSANDSNPEHIKEAYYKLKTLMKNVKVFSIDTVVSIIIDEDATVGMAWNGDAFKASRENKNIRFVFPEDGFVIWVDNFSIPKNAPHKDAAYQFINFMLRADVAKQAAISTSFSTANLAAFKLLPPEIRNNSTAYPSQEILKRGEFQTNLDDKTLAIYEGYWNKLKVGGW